METDIEEIGDDTRFTIKINEAYIPYVYDLLNFTEKDNWTMFQKALLKKYKFPSMPRRIEISYIYRTLIRQGKIHPNKSLEEKIITKQSCGMSGVMVVTISTKPDRFSCKYNCYYCPSEPNMPRSYLSDEPVLVQAKKYDFDVVKQFHRRANILYHMEHKLDKLEVIVVGGTWSCYDHTYQEEFIRDIYYASNVFYDTLDEKPVRERLDLETEKTINETAQCRIISLTLETRPDMVTIDEIKRFRKFGCTKIQLGVQHTDTEILKLVNRQCYYEDTVRAIEMLKSSGFKIDLHLMENLPGSTPAKDIEMLNRVINDPDLQADQWKIYPCMVLPYTRIREWYENKTYVPYSEEELKRVVKFALSNVPIHIRVNRIMRDFTSASIISESKPLDLRDVIQKEFESEGIFCQDIRSREVKSKSFDVNDIELVVRKYFASNGLEYFLSHESHDRKTLYSLLRLRINGIRNTCVYPELRDVSFVRELHTYGKIISHNDKPTASASQHKGLGKELLLEAERITQECGYKRICVISGEGVKGYYKKLGYVETVGGYLVKQL